MPYASNADLNDEVKKTYKSEHQRTAFRKAFNAALTEYKDEATAFAVAHKAAQGAKESSMERIWVTGGNALQESAYDPKKGQLTITIIKPGLSKNNRYYSPELLKKSAGIFENAKMFADHATDKESAARPEGSVKDWVATVGS